MLYLLLETGPHRHALDASRVVEVLPLLRIEPLPGLPPAFPGLIRFGGLAVPVLDLARLTLGRPTSARLGTRIVLVRRNDPAQGLLGLLVERAARSVRAEASSLQRPAHGLPLGTAGSTVITDAQGFITLLDPERLLAGTSPAEAGAAIPSPACPTPKSKSF